MGAKLKTCEGEVYQPKGWAKPKNWRTVEKNKRLRRSLGCLKSLEERV